LSSFADSLSASPSNHAPVDIFASSSEHDDSGSGSDAERDRGSVSDGSNNSSVSSTRSFFLAATGTRLDRDAGDDLLADFLRSGVFLEKDLFTVVYGAVRRLTAAGLRIGAIGRRKFAKLRLFLRVRSAAYLESAGGYRVYKHARRVQHSHLTGFLTHHVISRVFSRVAKRKR
jgi:hypothetical protein